MGDQVFFFRVTEVPPVENVINTQTLGVNSVELEVDVFTRFALFLALSLPVSSKSSAQQWLLTPPPPIPGVLELTVPEVVSEDLKWHVANSVEKFARRLSEAEKNYTDAFNGTDQVSYDLAEDQRLVDTWAAEVELYDNVDFLVKAFGSGGVAYFGLKVSEFFAQGPAQAKAIAAFALVTTAGLEGAARAIKAHQDKLKALIGQQVEYIRRRTAMIYWELDQQGSIRPPEPLEGCAWQEDCVDRPICITERGVKNCEWKTFCVVKILRCPL